MKIFQQKCPRCGEKHLEQAKRCDYCGLIFSRLEKATNGAAKRAYKEGKRNKLILVKKWPQDVSKIKLILYAVFLGLLGVHLFYVGRYIKACFRLIGGIITFVAFGLSINGQLTGSIEAYGVIISGITSLCWLYDLGLIAFGGFRVPVYLDSESENDKK